MTDDFRKGMLHAAEMCNKRAIACRFHANTLPTLSNEKVCFRAMAEALAETSQNILTACEGGELVSGKAVS